ncbi:hypothetical protein BGX31_001252, partial [Mortierella sp. GBA43]
ARTTDTTKKVVSVTMASVVSLERILEIRPAAVSTQRKGPGCRKPSITKHTERLQSGQARSVLMLKEQFQNPVFNYAKPSSYKSRVPASRPEPVPESASESSEEQSEPEPEPRRVSVHQESSSTESPSSSSSESELAPVALSTAAPTAIETTTPSISEDPTPPYSPRSPSSSSLPLSSSTTAPTALSSETTPLPSSVTPPTTTLTAADTVSDIELIATDSDASVELQIDESASSVIPPYSTTPNVTSQPTFPTPLHPLAPPPYTPDAVSEAEDTTEEQDQDDQVESSAPVQERKASSASINIPQSGRNRGSPSEPASLDNSPNITTGSPSSQGTTKSFPLAHYSHVRQNSTGVVAIVPEGCIDPTDLIEAKRVNDDDDKFDPRTFGPSDHPPKIPISPLRTTYRALVEKEKSWSLVLVETKEKIQELQRKDGNVEREIVALREEASKHNTQINITMATIVKVRELLYRSAGVTSILEFPPHLVAYQLTLIESAIFLEIPPNAFMTHSTKTPHRSIAASTDFFNYLTRVIEYSILFPADPNGRSQIINHWIKIAVKLHELENFQTLKAVLCALVTPPIKRLKRTWGLVNRKSAQRVEVLFDLMSEDRNYGKYREMMSSLCSGTIASPGVPDVASPTMYDFTSAMSGNYVPKDNSRRPVVPFLGTFIMDMTYLLAAVKKNSSPGSSSASVNKISPSPSLRKEFPASNLSKGLKVQTDIDPRIQDLLNTVQAYQSGPRYAPQPPKAYMKSSTKPQHHFRAPSLSSALRRSSEFRNLSAADVFDDDDGELLGGAGGIRPTQQLISHYLLTRPWAPERMMDELSMIREPSKNTTPSRSYSSFTSMDNESPRQSISAEDD